MSIHQTPAQKGHESLCRQVVWASALGTYCAVVGCRQIVRGLYGAAEGGRDYNTLDLFERALREIYLPPFKVDFDAGAASTMVAYNEISGVPVPRRTGFRGA